MVIEEEIEIYGNPEINKLTTTLESAKQNAAEKNEKLLKNILKENGFEFEKIKIYNIQLYYENFYEETTVALIYTNNKKHYLPLEKEIPKSIKTLLKEEKYKEMKNNTVKILIDANTHYKRIMKIKM